MKRTLFHDFYDTLRKDWDRWIVSIIILALCGYGLLWLSTRYDLNPLNWLASLGNYAYEHGGTISFIVVAFCITALVLVPIVISAWKAIRTDVAPWVRRPSTAFEAREMKEASEEIHAMKLGMKDTEQRLKEIERSLEEIKKLLQTTI